MFGEWSSDVTYRLRAMLRRRQLERELDAEIRDHLEREAARYRHAGLTPANAARQARVAFGGIERTKEECRDSRGLAVLDASTQTVRYAWRSLRRRPGLVAAVAVTLGLGLGANAAMFQVVDQLLLRPPPYLGDPSAVNRVYLAARRGTGDPGDPHAGLQYTRYRDLTRWTTAFAQTAAFTSRELPVGSGQATREMTVAPVSASFFSLFDAPPIVGRYFGVQEDSAPMGAAVAVLGYAFWRAQFGGRSDVIGRTLQVGPQVYTVIGVAPKDFVGTGDGLPPSVFVPITTFGWRLDHDASSYARTYHFSWLQMLVRRRPGVSTTAAAANLTSAFRRSYLVERSQDPWLPPIEFARPRAIAAPVLAERGPDESATARVATWVAGVAAIVLLIACANVTSLLLATASERRGEIALRLALGMSDRRLAGQLLTECALLAVIAGASGLLVARFGGELLTSMFVQSGSPALASQPRTLVFEGLVTLVAGIVTGLVPAVQARRTDVIEALKGARRGVVVSHHSRTRGLLLLLQSALSVILLIGAGLFIRSVEHVRAVPLGFDVDPVLYASVDTRGLKLDSTARRALSRRMIDAATAIPGVTDGARVFGVPFLSTLSTGLFVPGIDSVDRLGQFTLEVVSPDFFRTVGTRIVRGRGFTTADAAGAPRVALVSEAMAQVLWPDQDALGKRMRLDSATAAFTTIVGITENTVQSGLTDDRRLHYYLPTDQFDPGTVELLVRTRGNATGYEATVRRVLQSLMPGPAYVSLVPMREILDPEIRSWRLGAEMFLAFGGLALIVTAAGLYSVVSYDVARRTHELGVRVALGARTRHVLRAVAEDSARFAGIGVLVGSALALATGPLVAPLLFAESPRDPVVFGLVAAVLGAAAAAAIVVPVVRASRVAPGTALRAE